jgi:hypothetical protein
VALIYPRHPEQPLHGAGFWEPWGTTGKDGVSVDHELSGASDESDFVGFASGDEALVERHELGVPAEGAWQGCRVDAFSQAGSPACDVAFAFTFAAVAIERSKARQSRRLLTGETAELGHADEESERGPGCDAIDADQETETTIEILMPADGGDKLCDHSRPPLLKPSHVGQHDAAQIRLAHVLETDLDPGDVFLDLLDEGEVIAESLGPVKMAGAIKLL